MSFQINNLILTSRPSRALRLVFFLFLIPVLAQQDMEDKIREASLKIQQIKKENSRLDQSIARVDSLTADEKARSEKMAANYIKDLARRQKELAELSEKLLDADKKIQREVGKKSGYQNKIDELNKQQVNHMRILAEQCGQLELAVSGSIPWELPLRLERIRVLKRDLESGAASLEEGFNRLNAIYSEEIKFGDEAAFYQKPVTRNNGDVVNARILKIGNQWVVYADEEDKHYGVLQRTKTAEGFAYSWREDLDFSERSAVRNALEVKMAKTPPSLVTLPLTLALEPVSDQKGEE